MRLLLALPFALLATGCFKMTIVNGDTQPASGPAIEDRWRSSAVLDIIAIDTPLALDATCKGSTWAKIEQQHSALDYLVDVFLAGWVYESTHATVWCAARTGPAAQPPISPPVTGTPTSPPPTGTPTAPIKL